MFMKRVILLGIFSILGMFFIAGCLPVEPVTHICIKQGTNEKMSLEEAKIIAETSECVVQGPLKEEAMCNQYTGTWWIDIDIEKEMCNPACVVNVLTKNASVNWRCTGAIS